jgi:hypothetical protein
VSIYRDLVAPLVALALVAANLVAWSSICQTVIAW